jgi:AraC-like DNA-binding protein
MIYIERNPHPALAPYIKLFWYTRNPLAQHGLERVLPTAHLQIVMSLARDYLTDCNGSMSGHSAASILGGIRSRYQVIDRFDMTELIGVIFRPGGTTPFFPMSAHDAANTEIGLGDLWGRHEARLRDRLRESGHIGEKFRILDAEFLQRLAQRRATQQPPALSLALTAMHGSDEALTVGGISRRIGLSTRRLSEIFREQVGTTPKLYLRILRFQKAVQQLHRGTDVRWMDLALNCGYYDQSHFVNDFREFSGINPTTYSATRRLWSNHILID